MTILNGGGANMETVILRCTKDGTNYDYIGTDTRPSSGEYLKYTNGSKTGYLFLNSINKGYVASLRNNKKLRVNDYYVQEINNYKYLHEPYYDIQYQTDITWASINSSNSDGYIRSVRPRLRIYTALQAVMVKLVVPPVYGDSLSLSIYFKMPSYYQGGNNYRTHDFSIKINQEIYGSSAFTITDDDYYAPTYSQMYMSSNFTFDCYVSSSSIEPFPSIHTQGTYYDFNTFSKESETWYRTAEG